MASFSESDQIVNGIYVPRALACARCRQFRKKCDRKLPCSTCTKAKAECIRRTRATSRGPKKSKEYLLQRLERCETLLSEHSAASSSRPHDGPSLPQNGNGPVGKLVNELDCKRYKDSYLLDNIHEELQEMRKAISLEPDDISSAGEVDIVDNPFAFILGGEIPEDTIHLKPKSYQVLYLWQTFLDRFNPLTKVVHVPTLQPLIFRSAHGASTVPKSTEALLFSIYTVSVLTMLPEECHAMLGCSKSQALRRFSAGVRTCLYQLDFLHSYQLETLQSLFLYLISLRGKRGRQMAWTLNGMAIRMAQKMGLHRDGENLGLRPFETEMRRRLWWQMMTVDVWFASMSQLSHSFVPQLWDTKLPKNLDDNDMNQNATKPFEDKIGPTEMVFCLINYKITDFLVRRPGFEATLITWDLEQQKTRTPPGQTGQVFQLLGRLENELSQALDRYCDVSVGPLHQMAYNHKSEVIAKLAMMAEQRRNSKLMDIEIFGSAVCTTERNARVYSSIAQIGKGFLWYASMHFQLDLFFYVIMQLSVYTRGELVDRAWDQVEWNLNCHPELMDLSNKTSIALARLILQAWQLKEEKLEREGEPPSVAPSYVCVLQERLSGLKPGAGSDPCAFEIVPGHQLDGPTSFPNHFIEDIEAFDHNWGTWQNPSATLNPETPSRHFGNLGFGIAPTEW